MVVPLLEHFALARTHEKLTYTAHRSSSNCWLPSRHKTHTQGRPPQRRGDGPLTKNAGVPQHDTTLVSVTYYTLHLFRCFHVPLPFAVRVDCVAMFSRLGGQPTCVCGKRAWSTRSVRSRWSIATGKRWSGACRTGWKLPSIKMESDGLGSSAPGCSMVGESRQKAHALGLPVHIRGDILSERI